MTIKRLFWIAIIITVALPLGAQTGTDVFAPIVSRIRGVLRNNLVGLSWVDSPDARGPVYIYRSAFPFDSQNTGTGIRPVEVQYGVQSYVDEIEIGETGDGTSLHYFIAASDETGRRYMMPVAAANTTSVRVSLGGGAYNALTRTSNTSGILQGDDDEEPETGLPAGISSIEAAAQGDRAIITFNEGLVNNVVLYRSIRPIKETQDLLGAVIIQTKVTSPYTDYPVPGIPYYYAAVGENDIVLGTVVIYPGHNATVLPVEVSIAGRGGAVPETVRRDIRPMPLPELSAQTAAPGMNAYNKTSSPVKLSPEAERVLNGLSAHGEQALKTPRVFARDLEPVPVGSEDYALNVVVNGPFSARDWDAARDAFVKFLALPRSPEISSRARFYLGQCWYFMRQPREGLFEFLAIQDYYPYEAMEWIQASLDMINAGF